MFWTKKEDKLLNTSETFIVTYDYNEEKDEPYLSVTQYEGKKVIMYNEFLGREAEVLYLTLRYGSASI